MAAVGRRKKKVMKGLGFKKRDREIEIETQRVRRSRRKAQDRRFRL